MGEWWHRLIIGMVLSVVGFFLVATYNRLSSIECQLARLQIDLASMRIMTADDVRQIARLEIYNALQNQKN